MLKHLGIIMDGNGRWAKKRNMPRTYGHNVAAKKLGDIIKYAKKRGIETVTVYAFSKENWDRPKKEVDFLMSLFEKYLDEIHKQNEKDNIKIKIIGDKTDLSEKLIKKISEVEEKTKNNKFTFNIAVNYSGRDEIVRAVNKVVDKGENITEETISNNLDTANVPDPDMIIRTSGEMRISGFMLWQMAYSEFMFIDKLWPDFEKEDLDIVINEYNKRNRTFGLV